MKPSLTTLRFNDDWPMLKKVQHDMAVKYHGAIVPPKQPGQIFRSSVADLRYVAPDWTLRTGTGAAMQALLERLLQHELV
jgi:hypothetical protein